MRIRPTATAAVATVLLAGTPAAAGSASGASWQLLDVPLPSGVTLNAQSVPSVSCGTQSLCALVVSRAQPNRDAAVADLLTDSGFTSQLLPAPAGSYDVSLGNVSCASASDCVAVGYSADPDSGRNWLAETFDGAGWTAAPAPQGDVPELQLSDVACNPARCVAVGDWQDYMSTEPYLAERGSDGRWVHRTITPAEAVGAAPAANRYLEVRSLFSPACTPDGPCYTLGYQDLSPVLLYSSGTTWTSRRLPVPGGVNQNDLRMGGMACAAALNCASIGTYVNATADRQYLLGEVFRDGQLVAQPIPIPSGWHTLHDPLNPRAIACPAVDRCVGVVGFRYSTARHGALIVTYDGTRWASRIAPAPQGAVDAAATDLTGVACVSRGSCTAVGAVRMTSHGSTVLRPLVETLVASTWRPSHPVRPADIPTDANVGLDDVSCAGTTCLADGHWSTAGASAQSGLIVGVAR